MEEKSKIGNSNEKTVVLKGDTILNYLHKYFYLLWMVKNLFVEKPTYSTITNFQMAHVKLVN